MSNFGITLEKLRRGNNLQSKELAQKCNISNSFVTKMEKGHSLPSYFLLKKLEGIFKVGLEEAYWLEKKFQQNEALEKHRQRTTEYFKNNGKKKR